MPALNDQSSFEIERGHKARAYNFGFQDFRCRREFVYKFQSLLVFEFDGPN
jgi:hypothetical protein